MARALIVGVRAGGQTGQLNVVVGTCVFSGADVGDLVGQTFDLTVPLPLDYTLSDLRAGLIDAANAKGAELGLTLAVGAVDIPTFEQQATPP